MAATAVTLPNILWMVAPEPTIKALNPNGLFIVDYTARGTVSAHYLLAPIAAWEIKHPKSRALMAKYLA